MTKLREGGNADGSLEKARLRERQRRSITTKIFNGLRKHGNYNLAPRADINDVLRALAKEAGWVVEPDGTTYRSNPNATKATSRPLDLGASSLQQCPACTALGSYGRGKSSSSHGGDCATTASPRHVSLQQPSNSSGEGPALRPTSASWHPYPARWAPASSGRNPTRDWDAALALTGSGAAAGCLLDGAHLGSMGYVGAGGSHSLIPHQQLAFFQEARDSSHSSPIASPPRLYLGAL